MVRVSIKDQRAEVARRRLPLSPHFFQLYCLLAYYRGTGNDRFLTVRDIQRLPRWHRAAPDSIGKSIHRHVAQMRRAGWHLIESPPRGGTKLFRLKKGAGPISFDLPLTDVRACLGLDLIIRDRSRREVERVLRSSSALVRARLDMEAGDFQRAKIVLDEAEQVPDRGPKERIDSLLLRSRLFEHEGRLQDAVTCAEEALAIGRRHGVDYLTRARTDIRLGFLYVILRRSEQYPQARAHYLEAFRLLEGHWHFTELSQVAGGLGHLARREADYDTAHAHFLRALEYAVADAWGWGIQAAYFNLGLAQAERGDMLRDPDAARLAFLDAARWLELAYEFVRRTGMKHTSEGQAVLSHVYLKLGRANEALTWAKRALEAARIAGNKKAEAVALTALGECQQAVGAHEEARASLIAAHSLYLEIGIDAEAKHVAELIRRHTPSAPASAVHRLVKPAPRPSEPRHPSGP